MKEIWVNIHAVRLRKPQVVHFTDPNQHMGLGEEGYVKYVTDTSSRELRARLAELASRVEELERGIQKDYSQAHRSVAQMETWLRSLTGV